MDTEPDKKVQVQIEVGHSATCRETTTAEGYTHDWSIFVRGAKGADISHFVEKVVFILHESFPKPKRSLTKPPYKIEERGYGSFNLPVEIHFRNKEVPRKHKLDYDLFLQLVGMPPVNNTKVEALTFLNPAAEFEQKLLKGGAVILSKDNQVFSPASRPDNNASPSTSLSPNSTQIKRPLTPQTGNKLGKIKEPPTPSRTSPINGANPVAAKRSISPNDPPPPSNSSQIPPVPGSNLAKKKKIDKQGDKIDSPSSISSSKQNKDGVAVIQVSVNTPSPGSKNKSKDKKEKSSKDKRKTSAEVSPVDSSPAAASFNTATKLKSELKFVKKDKKEKKAVEKRLLSPEKSDAPSELQRDGDVPPPPKLQKITMKRTATDAWTKSKSDPADSEARTQAFFRKLAEDDTDSEDISDIESKPVTSAVKRTPDNSLEGFDSSGGKPQKKNKSPRVTTPNPVNKNSSNKTDTNKGKNAQLTGRSPNLAPSSKKPTTKINEHISGTPPSNGVARPDLIELYRRISQVDDNDTLQEIVDIVERSGLFEITTTTFDFDLQYLDSDTINLLQRYFVDNP